MATTMTPDQRIRHLEAELAALRSGSIPQVGGGLFKVLQSQHQHTDGVVYHTGQIVDSDSDLVLRFGGEKFLKVGERPFPLPPKEVVPVVDPPSSKTVVEVPDLKPTDNGKVDELSKMTIAELKETAAKEGIELGTATKKDDIVKIIADWRAESEK